MTPAQLLTAFRTSPSYGARAAVGSEGRRAIAKVEERGFWGSRGGKSRPIAPRHLGISPKYNDFDDTWRSNTTS